MKNISKNTDVDRALPLSVVYLVAFVLLLVGCATIYYGFNDGILHQDLTAWTKSGRIANFKGITAVLAGGAVTCIGLVFAWLALFIVRNEREQKILKGK